MPRKAEWRSAGTMCGGLSAMTCGEMITLMLCAHNLDCKVCLAHTEPSFSSRVLCCVCR